MPKFGVSFYSYQHAYRTGKLDLEGCLRALSQIPGADGVELLATQTPPAAYPYPTRAEIEKWNELLDKYHLVPTCFDSQYPGHDLPTDLGERETYLRSEIEYASKLGFTSMRLAIKDLPTVEKCLGYAEDHNMVLNLEIHVPMTITGPDVTEYCEMIDRTGTKFAGIQPDMAIFLHHLPQRIIDQTLFGGGDPKAVQRIAEAFAAGECMEEACAAVKQQYPDTNLGMLPFFATINSHPSKPEELRLIAPYLTHFHAKFYEFDENLHEPYIYYKEAMGVLKEIGFDGYLCSEYEGQRMFYGGEEPDEIEQVRRNHAAMHKLLD